MPETEASTPQLAMARLMAVAGHDLKQPLHVAMMYAVRAMEDGVTEAAARRLHIAIDAMKRLDSELNDIARLSQMGGAQMPRRTIVSIADVLARLDRDWRFYAEVFGVELALGDDKFLVESDPDMLHSILRNFIGNAIKYAGPGGHVRVSCRISSGRLVVSVEDDGCGIAAGRLETIFDAFERGDQAGRSDGLGLGLAIVRQTADLLRHRVSVRSVENEGSVFSIELPLHRPVHGHLATVAAS